MTMYLILLMFLLIILFLCPIGTTSTLLVVIGILQYISNNSSNELLMIGIVLVRNSVKPAYS